ncbi:endonuclease/exonuclease/phosphatase family protein [Anatilimnocola sp. NA78]|uniref:endonuclease/exonuclease/phosphatase family protein n=1 Tax=Anatilimnocola sp. NA78 TaxID=3415683 RepID=UPI003CE47681
MAQPTSNGAERTPRQFFGRMLFLAVRTPTLFVLLFAVVGFFARYSWHCELLCHFRLQYAWLLLLAGVALLIARSRWFAVIAGVGAAVNFAFVLPIYWPAEQPTAASESWRLVSYNVLGSNNRSAEVLAMLRAETADVVLLYEVNARWAKEFATLRDEYPHQKIVPRENNFGIALLSRRRWDDVQVQYFGQTDFPSIVAQFTHTSQLVTLIGTHPPPPVNRYVAQVRNQQLAGLAQFTAEASGPVILAGDLNVTSYSPYFQDLLRVGKLSDSRQGFGVQASWNKGIPGMAIPIDHVLVSPTIGVVSRRIGRPLGSDHCPVMVELKLPSL